MKTVKVCRSIAKCGKPQMVRYLKDTSFTISTATVKTIVLKILFVCQNRNTLDCMLQCVRKVLRLQTCRIQTSLTTRKGVSFGINSIKKKRMPKVGHITQRTKKK